MLLDLPIRHLALACAGTLVLTCIRPSAARAFVPMDRWETTAQGTTHERGNPAVVTWSIVADGTPIRNAAPSNLVALLDESFDVGNPTGPLSDRPWFGYVASAFDRWSEVGGVEFRYEPADDGATHGQSPGRLGTRGDVRLAGVPLDGPRGVIASSQFPDGGDIHFDTSERGFLLDPPGDYRRFRNVLMHEIGHTLGLGHIVSSDAQMLMEPELSLEFDGPQLDDIRGLHYLYGDRWERNGGNNSPAMATDLGTLKPESPLAIGADAKSESFIATDDIDFVSISRRTDTDYFAFSVDAAGWLDVTLTPRGGVFHQALPGELELRSDAHASSNLRFEILNSNATLLASVDETLHGAAETLRDFGLQQNAEYYLRVSGTRNTVQLYDLQLRFQTLPVPEPTSWLLLTVGIGAGGACGRRTCFGNPR